ncbi:MAG: flagellar protein FlbB [Treponema sp.]|nr:flagellar protein FlbB [Treponema sp.]
MAKSNSFGKTVVLLFLIVILVLGGLLWFDFLGVIRVKSIFNPIYKAIGWQRQTSTTSTSTKPLTADLDQDRLDKQREALDLYREELEKREADTVSIEEQNQRLAQEIADREKNLEEREKTFNNTVKMFDDRNSNIEQIAANLEGMQPLKAVDILVAMDDQLAIDVLRKVTERAQNNGVASMVPYWLSLMPADRAAVIQRKMTARPSSID